MERSNDTNLIPSEKLQPIWTPLTRDLYFECKRCGFCCRNVGYIYLNATDIECISKRINKIPGQFVNLRLIKFPNDAVAECFCLRQFKNNGEFPCIFLEGNKCSIYDDRPLVCKNYPFGLIRWSEFKKKFPNCKNPVIVRDGNLQFGVVYDKRCRGITKGEHINLNKKNLLEEVYEMDAIINFSEIAYGHLYQDIIKDFEILCEIPLSNTKWGFECSIREKCLGYIFFLNILGMQAGPTGKTVKISWNQEIKRVFLDWRDILPTINGGASQQEEAEAGEKFVNVV